MFELIKPFNIILACDTYKFDHHREYPADSEYIYSAVVPRKSSNYATKVVVMGNALVAFLLSKIRVEQWMIDEAEIEINQQGYEFNREGWEIIVREFDGKLPITYFGVEDGRVVDPQTPVAGIINTDKRFKWLVTYIETWVQEIVWKMSTVASMTRAVRLKIKHYMELTGSDMSGLDYKYHNFGDRGADSPHEAPIMAGIAHAALFNGSDCARANGYIKTIYRTAKSYTSSVVATEHSVMCSHSDAVKKDDFGAAKMAVGRLKEVVERTKNGIGIPLMSVVIDTYDSRRFVREYMGGAFKQDIINSGGKMVMRPDSGVLTVEPVTVAKDLDDTFGSTINDAGFKVLHSCVGILQGDGVKVTTVDSILQSFVDEKFSIDNIVLGSGSGVSHEGSRDDFSFSMKAIAHFNGTHWVRLLKEPKTDAGKKSLTGLVRCYEDAAGNLQVTDYLTKSMFPTDQFLQDGPGWRKWFENGHQTYIQSFDSVCKFARAGT
jgi:nicotinamide phosphoribosyltransferase